MFKKNLKNKYAKKQILNNSGEENSQDEEDSKAIKKDDENNCIDKERINKQNINSGHSNIYNINEIYSKNTCKESNISSLDNEDINKVNNEGHNLSNSINENRIIEKNGKKKEWRRIEGIGI